MRHKNTRLWSQNHSKKNEPPKKSPPADMKKNCSPPHGKRWTGSGHPPAHTCRPSKFGMPHTPNVGQALATPLRDKHHVHFLTTSYAKRRTASAWYHPKRRPADGYERVPSCVVWSFALAFGEPPFGIVGRPRFTPLRTPPPFANCAA